MRKVRLDGSSTWYARYIEPDTGNEVQTNLTRMRLRSAEVRRDWAIRRAKALAKRNAELEAGLPLRGNTPITVAVKEYFHARSNELRASTLAAYNQGTGPFVEWAASVGLKYTDDVTPARLMQFRVSFGSRTAMDVVNGKGVGRGRRVPGKRQRSAVQVNKCLRALKTVLNHWRRLGLTPRVSSDTIADCLPYHRAPRPMRKFLTAAQTRDLFKAAGEHDCQVFNLTRDEKFVGLTSGSTSRYIPIAPFIAMALLTGCRVGEVLKLKWSSISDDLAMLNLEHDETKTHHARRVDLRVSPWLIRLLEKVKPPDMNAAQLKDWFVFGGKEPYTYDLIESARARLISDFAAPQFDWRTLRRTCGTFLVCAPGIYGGASAYMAARRLGHSVDVAERHYLGVVSDVAAKARTLEAALGVEAQVRSIVNTLGANHEFKDLAARKPATA